MLNEEEKHAIEILTRKVDDWDCKRPKNPLIFNGIVDEIDKDNNAIRTAIKLITKLQGENEEKDKQIDLMSKFIFQNIDIEEDICNSVYVECKQKTSQDITCINCVKQYFKKLAEEK